MNLKTDDLEIAQTIARAVRHINGGYRYVRGMGFALEDKGMVQVSMNLVNYEKYGGVTLTEEGRKIGEDVDSRHRLIKSFLQMLGVAEEIADIDACEVEHSLHPETLERLQMFLDAVHKNPERYPFLNNDDQA